MEEAEGRGGVETLAADAAAAVAVAAALGGARAVGVVGAFAPAGADGPDGGAVAGLGDRGAHDVAVLAREAGWAEAVVEGGGGDGDALGAVLAGRRHLADVHGGLAAGAGEEGRAEAGARRQALPGVGARVPPRAAPLFARRHAHLLSIPNEISPNKRAKFL